MKPKLWRADRVFPPSTHPSVPHLAEPHVRQHDAYVLSDLPKPGVLRLLRSFGLHTSTADLRVDRWSVSAKALLAHPDLLDLNVPLVQHAAQRDRQVWRMTSRETGLHVATWHYDDTARSLSLIAHE